MDIVQQMAVHSVEFAEDDLSSVKKLLRDHPAKPYDETLRSRKLRNKFAKRRCETAIDQLHTAIELLGWDE